MGPDLKYWIVPVVEDNEQPINESLHVSIMNKDRQPYISIPLSDQKLFQNIAIADLDGDGEYEFIIKWPDTKLIRFKGQDGTKVKRHINSMLTNWMELFFGDLISAGILKWEFGIPHL